MTDPTEFVKPLEINGVPGLEAKGKIWVADYIPDNQVIKGAESEGRFLGRDLGEAILQARQKQRQENNASN